MKTGLIIFALMLLTSCDQANTINLKIVKVRVEPAPTVQNPVGNSTGFKVTPGAGRLTGTDVSAQATILVNDRTLTGSHVSGKFSISKTQVK